MANKFVNQIKKLLYEEKSISADINQIIIGENAHSLINEIIFKDANFDKFTKDIIKASRDSRTSLWSPPVWK